MNCFLTSQRPMIWSWVNTRTHTNRPWNWNTCWCVNSLFSKILQGHQLKPHEQHWFQQDKTEMCFPAHSSLTSTSFYGAPLTTQQTATAGSTRGASCTLLREYADFCWRWVMADCPLPVTDLAGNSTPIFYTPTQEPAVPWCFEHYLESAVW